MTLRTPLPLVLGILCWFCSWALQTEMIYLSVLRECRCMMYILESVVRYHYCLLSLISKKTGKSKPWFSLLWVTAACSSYLCTEFSINARCQKKKFQLLHVSELSFDFAALIFIFPSLSCLQKLLTFPDATLLVTSCRISLIEPRESIFVFLF